jgi:hypothetical protein
VALRSPETFPQCRPQPILNKTDSVLIKNPKGHELLGFFGLSIYWRDLLSNLLPPGSNGITIVFENECSPTFSFQVNGPDVDYLGPDDFHDTKYDSMEIGVSTYVSR